MATGAHIKQSGFSQVCRYHHLLIIFTSSLHLADAFPHVVECLTLNQGGTVVQWAALRPHSQKGLGLMSGSF